MSKDYIKNIEGAERRFFSSEVRAAIEENKPAVIEGYAAKFNSETEIGYYYKFREKILPGAFDDVLNDDIRCLFNHDPNQVLARCVNGKGTLKLEVDEVGLKYSYTTPDRQFARDLADAIDKGDVSQSSFAFEIAEQRWIETDDQDFNLREIVKFRKLYDVSPVTYPAYADTEVAKRSFDSYKEQQNPNDETEKRGFNDEYCDNVVQMNQNLL